MIGEVLNYEETFRKWTTEEKKSPIGLLEKNNQRMIYKVYFHNRQYKGYGLNIWA